MRSPGERGNFGAAFVDATTNGAVERGVRIHFLVLYPENEAPAQRLKFEQYYERFRRAGFEVIHDAFYTPAL